MLHAPKQNSFSCFIVTHRKAEVIHAVRTDGGEAPDGAGAVHRHDADGVVEPDAPQEAVDAGGDDGADGADDQRLPRVAQRADACGREGVLRREASVNSTERTLRKYIYIFRNRTSVDTHLPRVPFIQLGSTGLVKFFFPSFFASYIKSGV